MHGGDDLVGAGGASMENVLSIQIHICSTEQRQAAPVGLCIPEPSYLGTP